MVVASLAVGIVLGLSVGLVLRTPEALVDPGVLFPDATPHACVEVAAAAEQMTTITADYLELIGNTYVPLLEQLTQERPAGLPFPDATDTPAAGTGDEDPVVATLLAAEQQLADLADRTAAATAVVHEAGVICRSQAGD